MKAIKVNADYETSLFLRKNSHPLMNESLEFLALYLDSRPLFSQKHYAKEFLDHVEQLTGHRPEIVSKGEFENWWGMLLDIDEEQRLNSKEMSTELSIAEKWCPHSKIIKDLSDLPELKRTFLAKNPYGMSGLNFCLVSEGRLENLEVMLNKGRVILEPLLERVNDFSHYIYADGTRICYENIVDRKFQYRGTIIQDYTCPSIENISFYQSLPTLEWANFREALEVIIKHYKRDHLPSGFSIDSFTYKENGELRIRYLSEVNYRRTMGQTAFELAIKFGGLRKWALLILCKSTGMSFKAMKEKLASLEWDSDTSSGVIILSPGNVRYDMFFLSATDEREGKKLMAQLQKLLPQIEFPIKI